MNAWLQYPDFSSKEVDLPDIDSFTRFFDELNLEELDEMGRNANGAPQENCPWGVGVNMGSTNGLHVYRADPTSDRFDVLHAKAKITKVFGFIPTETEDSDFYENVDRELVLNLAAMYYSTLK